MFQIEIKHCEANLIQCMEMTPAVNINAIENKNF